MHVTHILTKLTHTKNNFLAKLFRFLLITTGTKVVSKSLLLNQILPNFNFIRKWHPASILFVFCIHHKKIYWKRDYAVSGSILETSAGSWGYTGLQVSFWAIEFRNISQYASIWYGHIDPGDLATHSMDVLSAPSHFYAILRVLFVIV